MTGSLLISTSLIALLGVALLVLARLEPGHPHISDWGWSHVLLAVGLTLGIALVPADPESLHYKVQATAATAAIIASLALQLAGAARYRGRAWRWRVNAPIFLTLLGFILALALVQQRHAVVAAALILTGGAWLAAAWLWRDGATGERFVAACFAASGLVHLSGPLLDPLARSPITHILGTYVQAVLAMALILLSVRRAHHETQRVNSRLRQLYEQSMQGLLVVRDTRAVYANPAALAMFGFEQVEDIGPIGPMIASSDIEGARARYARLLEERSGQIPWEGERYRRDGSAIYLRGSSSYIEWEGGPALLVLILDDTERQRATEALRRQALHDELTDLPNRHAALARLAELTAPGSPGFALLSADLDRFQLVNESLGHETGDALLQAIAARLREALPPDALLARLGEDQFLLLQPGVEDDAAALLVGQRLLALMNLPFAVAHRALYVHLSVGIARFPAHGQNGAALLRAADIAMHQAKQQAGAAVVAFRPGMAAAAGGLLEIEQALASAIDREEFQLDYQPKFEAGAHRLAGFEALVRWQRPGRGRVSPADFIPAAERTGQIVPLGALILRQAAQQLRAWQQQGLAVMPVAVNVSPLQFEDTGFADWVLDLVRAHGVDPALIEVEITETAAMTHMDRVLPQLARLREAGVGVAFDDFGTGQSSLTLLRRLPITTLKLDRSMVDPLPEPSAGAVVQAACVVAEALGLAIVAEGVETEAQAAEVERLGCTHLQGWLLSRPLPPDAAAKLLSEPSVHPSGSSHPAATPG
ncbi:diguanylate cyclase (GGDEF)-like protein/PAS domain S-box-containing protein [Pelomonas saccharophila]|uniref:Diguanylate cyclase (GGDEF)-like protein/PAS domain S-box-containing protein n=1 Tax=Roseateles saccharophilus TaxID=304 RepID=A0ABU1YVP5_ROSSA|nr:EAL domain-containing protein [Roseateles saccharophilus]MDR7272937.1 diguanylate cyclase (GGDEF)-like protein/PAS domain S-box-containing protein [Roseateles saccharophilus]